MEPPIFRGGGVFGNVELYGEAWNTGLQGAIIHIKPTSTWLGVHSRASKQKTGHYKNAMFRKGFCKKNDDGFIKGIETKGMDVLMYESINCGTSHRGLSECWIEMELLSDVLYYKVDWFGLSEQYWYIWEKEISVETKPITAFIEEVESMPHAAHNSRTAYYKLMKSMENELKACITQCVSEDISFRREVISIKERLQGVLLMRENRKEMVCFATTVGAKVQSSVDDYLEKEKMVIRVAKGTQSYLDKLYPETLQEVCGLIVKNNEKDVYLFKELKELLGIKSDNTLKKIMNLGYISYSTPEGSDKVWFQKKDIIDFLEDPRIKHKSWNMLH